jgi:hypothetical protein
MGRERDLGSGVVGAGGVSSTISRLLPGGKFFSE